MERLIPRYSKWRRICDGLLDLGVELKEARLFRVTVMVLTVHRVPYGVPFTSSSGSDGFLMILIFVLSFFVILKKSAMIQVGCLVCMAVLTASCTEKMASQVEVGAQDVFFFGLPWQSFKTFNHDN